MLKDQARRLVSRPMLQPVWSRLLKLCHAGMNYGGGQSLGNSGELNALAFVARSFDANKPVVLFDVGANNGEYLEAARKVLHHHDLRVFAFEPQRCCFRLLQARYQGSPSIRIRHVALGKERGIVEIHFSEMGESTATLYGAISSTTTSSEPVEMTTVDDACSEAGVSQIDFLKIDTEGHEIDVLLGAQHVIDAGRVAALQFEFGETFLDTGYHFRDVFDLLVPRYSIHRILRRGLIEIPRYSHDLEIYKIANFLCLRKNSAWQ